MSRFAQQVICKSCANLMGIQEERLQTWHPESGACLLQRWVVVVVVVLEGSDSCIAEPCAQSFLQVDATCVATPNPESSFKTAFQRPQGTSSHPLRLNWV